VVGRRLPESMLEAVHYVASVEHIRLFTQGLIDTRPFVYYLSFTLVFLALTHQVVEFRRWKL
jgi:ABC-2 type transport system permease protein